jgi:hypothetical protein
VALNPTNGGADARLARPLVRSVVRSTLKRAADRIAASHRRAAELR